MKEFVKVKSVGNYKGKGLIKGNENSRALAAFLFSLL